MTAKNAISGRLALLKPACSFFTLFVDFIYPPFCLLCNSRLQNTERHICPLCWESFPQLSNPIVDAEIFGLTPPIYFERSFAAFEYSEALQEVIHAMKYNGISQLADRFGKVLAKKGLEEKIFDGIDCFVPVPLHPARRRERGFNQAALLARSMALECSLEVVHALRRVRYTNQQAKYNREQRVSNVRDAFKLSKGVNVVEKNIALVDDVITTGSTINECAKQLCDAGAHSILALTIVRI